MRRAALRMAAERALLPKQRSQESSSPADLQGEGLRPRALWSAQGLWLLGLVLVLAGAAVVAPPALWAQLLQQPAQGVSRPADETQASQAASASERAQSGWSQLDSEIAVYAYALKHKPAHAAMPLVYPLLSEKGTIEVQPADNTLIVRDQSAVLRRILPVLQTFDQPAENLRLKIQVVRAGSQAAKAAGQHSLPPRLLERLRELLRYQSYSVQASTELEAREGERVIYDLGEEFRIELRLGTVTSDARVRLDGVRLFRKMPAEGELSELIHTNLSLELGEPFLLGLAKSEASPDALMLVFTSDRARERRPMVAN